MNSPDFLNQIQDLWILAFPESSILFSQFISKNILIAFDWRGANLPPCCRGLFQRCLYLHLDWKSNWWPGSPFWSRNASSAPDDVLISEDLHARVTRNYLKLQQKKCPFSSKFRSKSNFCYGTGKSETVAEDLPNAGHHIPATVKLGTSRRKEKVRIEETEGWMVNKECFIFTRLQNFALKEKIYEGYFRRNFCPRSSGCSLFEKVRNRLSVYWLQIGDSEVPFVQGSFRQSNFRFTAFLSMSFTTGLGTVDNPRRHLKSRMDERSCAKIWTEILNAGARDSVWNFLGKSVQPKEEFHHRNCSSHWLSKREKRKQLLGKC
jgi:hypothetical protein